MSEQFLKQWLIKADNDLTVARHELSLPEVDRVTEAICFHCQQAAEKYLKAFLISRNQEIGKTHNLEYLRERCAQYVERFRALDLGDLTSYAVEVRYPDDFFIPSMEEAEKSLTITERIRAFVLGLIEKQE